MRMKYLKKKQLQFTLIYFVPMFVIIVVATFFVLRLHQQNFQDIQENIAAHSFQWDSFDMVPVDQKLETLNTFEDVLLDYESIPFERSEEMLPASVATPGELIIPVDFDGDEVFGIDDLDYISLVEYEDLTNKLYNETFQKIIIVSIILIVIFAFVSYRLSFLVLRPIVQAYEEQKQFISDASHELRTPVAILQSEIDLIERIPDISQDRYTQFVNNVRYSTKQLRHIIDQLIALTRLESAKKKSISKQKLSLVSLVEQCVSHYRSFADDQSVTIHFDQTQDIVVYSNEEYLNQVLSILCDNALRHNHPDGQVDIIIMNEGSNVTLQIMNTGGPIPEEKLPHIFKRFYRASESRHESGLGLGLPIAQEIAERLGGSLHIMNQGDRVVAQLRLPKKHLS